MPVWIILFKAARLWAAIPAPVKILIAFVTIALILALLEWLGIVSLDNPDTQVFIILMLLGLVYLIGYMMWPKS